METVSIIILSLLKEFPIILFRVVVKKIYLRGTTKPQHNFGNYFEFL